MSKTVPELPAASTPLDPADLFMVWQSGLGLARVPQADAIIDGVEVISNANGVAWRFPSGLQICRLETVQSYLAGNPAVGTHDILWTFPAVFSSASTYFIAGQNQTATAIDSQRGKVIGVARRESRTEASCNLFYEVTTLTQASVRIGAFAVGFRP